MQNLFKLHLIRVILQILVLKYIYDTKDGKKLESRKKQKKTFLIDLVRKLRTFKWINSVTVVKIRCTKHKYSFPIVIRERPRSRLLIVILGIGYPKIYSLFQLTVSVVLCQ